MGVSQTGKIIGTVKPIGGLSGEVKSDGSVRGNINVSQRSYNLLTDKPSINGTELIGNYDEIDPTVPEWAKSETKPTYTADEVEAVDRNNETDFAEIDRMFNAVFGTGI